MGFDSSLSIYRVRQFFFRYGTQNDTDMYWYTRTINNSFVGQWERIVNQSMFNQIKEISLSTNCYLIQIGRIIIFQLISCTSLPTESEITSLWGDDSWKPLHHVYNTVWQYPSSSSITKQLVIFDMTASADTITVKNVSNTNLTSYRLYGTVIWVSKA